MPGRLQKTNRAAAQAQHDTRRRDVPPLRVLGETESRSAGVELLDLVAEHPARDVEVVDELVDELAARGLDVGVGWWQRVAAGHLEAVDGAEFTGADAAARLLESGIKAALEPDLNAPLRLVDVRHHALRRLEIQRDRLLAEDREPFVERASDQIRVRPGRGHDDGGVRAGDGLVDGRRVLRAELLGEPGRARRISVVDPKLIDPGERAQDLGVERAEAAHAEDRDLHSTRL